jgi:hypothetical protein
MKQIVSLAGMRTTGIRRVTDGKKRRTSEAPASDTLGKTLSEWDAVSESAWASVLRACI